MKRFLKVQEDHERGASLVEYALLVSLVAVVAMAGIRVVGQTASGKFRELSEEMAASEFPECNQSHPMWPVC